jgi:hypothetical protein
VMMVLLYVFVPAVVITFGYCPCVHICAITLNEPFTLNSSFPFTNVAYVFLVFGSNGMNTFCAKESFKMVLSFAAFIKAMSIAS